MFSSRQLQGSQLGNHLFLCCRANNGQRICCTITHFIHTLTVTVLLQEILKKESTSGSQQLDMMHDGRCCGVPLGKRIGRVLPPWWIAVGTHTNTSVNMGTFMVVCICFNERKSGNGSPKVNYTWMWAAVNPNLNLMSPNMKKKTLQLSLKTQKQKLRHLSPQKWNVLILL